MNNNEDTWENEGGAVIRERREEEGDTEYILVVSSKPSGETHRRFTLLPREPRADPLQLPSEVATEAELVKTMEALGYRLHVIEGGSQTRRFHFKKISGGSSP
jgi:hypothetical protein